MNLEDKFSTKLDINGEHTEDDKTHLDDDEEYFSQSDDDQDTFSTPNPESKEDCLPDVIDESVIREKENQLDDSEKEERKTETLRLKELGNSEFKNGSYLEAVDFYTDALKVCLLIHDTERAILYANRSAAYMKLSKNDLALEDCEKAVGLNPLYVRARLRRAELYEKVDKLDEALEDYGKVLEQDPGQHAARAACMRLPDQIKIRNEKMKDEMLGKLKDLGNMFLKPFGLSTNNFNLQQDPNTGSYSVNFQQNTSKNN